MQSTIHARGKTATLYQETGGLLSKVRERTGIDSKAGCTYNLGCDPTACTVQ